MKTFLIKTAVACVALPLTLLALPAHAVLITFASNNTTGVSAQTGTDSLGDTWATTNGPAGIDSSFTMSDVSENFQPFNRLNLSNGLGTFANSFQMTLNSSQDGVGFKGILQTPVASGLQNGFITATDLNDSSTWVQWLATYSLLDNGLFQRVRFTAPEGTELSQGQQFRTNVNFSGIMTADSGWAASFDDRLAPVLSVPEPGSLALLLAGLVAVITFTRRKQS